MEIDLPLCRSNGQALDSLEYQRQSKGWITFMEHGWFLGVALISLLSALVFGFFTSLSAVARMGCLGVALALAASGVALIFRGKLPLYRQRRFFTFGSFELPEVGRASYRRGYGFIAFAVFLMLGLLLTTG
jgi:hypothetical protein